jgi:hypothetical protein
MYYTILKLPNIDHKIRISPITNEIFFNICKFIEENNDEDITVFIDEVLIELIQDTNIFNKLTRVDKCIILTKLYEQYIDPNITLYCSHKENSDIRNVNVESASIFKKIQDLSVGYFKTIRYNNIEIEISAPSKLFCKSYDEIMISMIHRVVYDGEEYYFSSFSDFDKDKFLESINIDLFKICTDVIKSNDTTLSLIDIPDDFEYENIYISYFNNSLYSLIKSLFSFDVKYLYENSYVFCKAMGSSYDHFKQITPHEFNQFINIHKYYNDKMNDYDNQGVDLS